MKAPVAVPMGRSLLRIAIGGAVALSAPVALAGTAEAVSASKWDRLAMCESSGNWAIHTRNGYLGGLQLSLSTWRAVGGESVPPPASRFDQINVARSNPEG